MEHDNINLGRIFTLGVVATFKGLRRAIGILGLLGLIVAGVLGLQARTPQQVVVNPNPVCDREVWQVQSAFLPPPEWGSWAKSVGANSPSFYVREAKGNGWCLVKQDKTLQIANRPDGEGRIRETYVHRWYEVPSKYGERVEQLAPTRDNRWLIAASIGFISIAILLGIWLPATILAAVGRRWTQEEPL